MTSKAGKPYSSCTSNNGFYDRWTCPGCYADLLSKVEGKETCGTCGRSIRLSLDYEPVCRAELLDEEDEP